MSSYKVQVVVPGVITSEDEILLTYREVTYKLGELVTVLCDGLASSSFVCITREPEE